MKIIIMQGIPASGKSTYAKQYAKDNQNCVRICRDDLRFMTGRPFSKSLESLVKITADYMATEALRAGFDLIIDETNIIQKTLNHWKKLAEHYGAEIEIKRMDISLAEALLRNANRTPNVPNDVVEMFYYMLHPIEKPIIEE